ncbi:hypothetical protein [Tenacibaculum ovolyticum]|uniref:hypothetical protein n=1 Tax=Tenacibaculum ovolyticum TaxID=104270 RepID=UPI0007EDCB04|nr:hypothetical protein [Tenacibaculum ovolyticum]
MKDKTLELKRRSKIFNKIFFNDFFIISAIITIGLFMFSYYSYHQNEFNKIRNQEIINRGDDFGLAKAMTSPDILFMNEVFVYAPLMICFFLIYINIKRYKELTKIQ